MEWFQGHIDHVIRCSLTALIARSFRHLKSGEELPISWLIKCFAWHLEEVHAGRCKRLIINVPPWHLKSISASVAFPAFVLGRAPSTTITLVCYSSELGEKMMRDIRDIMESDWYRRVFPETRLAVKQLGEITTTARGGINVTSVLGTLTGRGSDIIIIDDPIKPNSTFSDVERRKVNDWLGNTLFSRLNDKKTGRILVVMQRLHEDDVTGYLTQDPDHGWTLLKVPAIEVENTRYRISNRLGGEWHERAVGDVINPSREDRATLNRLKSEIGSLNFSAQYQQEPIPREGNMVQREWFRRYDTETFDVSDCDYIVCSWDTASEAGPGNDYSVGTMWGIMGEKLYLLQVYRRRLNFPTLRKLILATFHEHQADLLLLEKADSDRQLAQDLGLRRSQIRKIIPKDSKEDRMAAASHLIEGGRVYLPMEAPWLAAFFYEMLGFPGTKYDDQVDSVSQFLNWVRKGKRRLSKEPRSQQRPHGTRVGKPRRRSSTRRSFGGRSRLI